MLSKDNILNTFFLKFPLESQPLRICLLLFSYTSDLALNTLFYNDNVHTKFIMMILTFESCIFIKITIIKCNIFNINSRMTFWTFHYSFIFLSFFQIGQLWL